MRVILFRGKRKDNNEWVSGGYFYDGEKHFIIIKEKYIPDTRDWSLVEHYEKNPIYKKRYIEVIPETVGQYIGLVDENGKKIFEGDFIKMLGEAAEYLKEKELNNVFRVFYQSKGEFCGFAVPSRLKYEIIGNIHDNPELLKELNKE